MPRATWCPTPLHQKYAETRNMWFYKGDLRYGDEKDEGWRPYDELEYVAVKLATDWCRNEKLERAYKNKKTVVKLNDTYKADIVKMFQFRIKDTQKQRKIKREEKPDSSSEEEVKPDGKRRKLEPASVAGHEVQVLVLHLTMAGLGCV